MELDECINPDAIHRISISKEFFDMFGRDLITLLISPMEATLCEGSIPAKWVANPADLSDYLWKHESCITVPLGCSRGNISAKQYADWLFSLDEFSDKVVDGLATEIRDFGDSDEGKHLPEEMKQRIEKAVAIHPNATKRILTKYLKEAWIAAVGLEAEVVNEPDDLIDSVMNDFDPDPEDNPILKDLFQELFLHEQRQDIRKLCRYMGLHHIADKAAAMQLVSVPKIRQLALS